MRATKLYATVNRDVKSFEDRDVRNFIVASPGLHVADLLLDRKGEETEIRVIKRRPRRIGYKPLRWILLKGGRV